MTERKKKFLSLALSVALLISITGCKKDSIKLVFNEETNQFEYTGEIDAEALKNFYIIEFITSDNYKYLRLVREEQKSILGKEYRDFNGYVVDNDSNGHILNIIPFNSYIKENKSSYSGEEIFNIYSSIEDEYAKKLELKK